MKHRYRNSCVYDKCLITILLWNFMTYKNIWYCWSPLASYNNSKISSIFFFLLTTQHSVRYNVVLCNLGLYLLLAVKIIWCIDHLKYCLLKYSYYFSMSPFNIWAMIHKNICYNFEHVRLWSYQHVVVLSIEWFQHCGDSWPAGIHILLQEENTTYSISSSELSLALKKWTR